MGQRTNPGGGVALGRMVHLVLGDGAMAGIRATGANPYQSGDVVAATIVRVWDAETGSVNVKAHIDGPQDVWFTSVRFSDDDTAVEKLAAGETPDWPANTWHWPPRVP